MHVFEAVNIQLVIKLSNASAMTTQAAETPSMHGLQPAEDDVAQFPAYLVNAFPNPVFIKDDKHRIVFFNDAFSAMLGRSRDELLGKSDFDLVPVEEARVY